MSFSLAISSGSTLPLGACSSAMNSASSAISVSLDRLRTPPGLLLIVTFRLSAFPVFPHHVANFRGNLLTIPCCPSEVLFDLLIMKASSRRCGVFLLSIRLQEFQRIRNLQGRADALPFDCALSDSHLVLCQG